MIDHIFTAQLEDVINTSYYGDKSDPKEQAKKLARALLDLFK